MFVHTLDDVVAAGRLKELQGGDTRSARYLTAADGRNGPRELDSVVSGIFLGFQAAKSRRAWSKYTASGVRRSSAL